MGVRAGEQWGGGDKVLMIDQKCMGERILKDSQSQTLGYFL